MTRKEPAQSRGSRRWPYFIAAVVLALAGWAFFHPDLRPDPQLVDASVRAELARTGFKATHGVSFASFESHESQGGQSRDVALRQVIVPVDALLTEKRSRRYVRENTLGVLDEASGLYVGPIAVVRFARVWPALIGELLPYHFWTRARLSEFVIEEKHDFPHAPGGRIVAKLAYEMHHGDGKPAPPDRGRLRCEVRDVVAADSVDARLSGLAARIDCEEVSEVDGDAAYSHWYILDRGWSIALEGEHTFRVGDYSQARRWRSKLMSFE